MKGEMKAKLGYCQITPTKKGQKMGEIIANANWLAVIVGTVLCMVLGFLWYNPKSPTGQIWAAGINTAAPADIPPMGMVMNTIGLLLAAIFVGAVGWSVALLAILAYGALNVTGNIFAGASAKVGLVHTGYWLVAMVIVTAVHVVL